MYSSLTCDPGTAYPMNCVRSFAVLFVMFCCCCLFCLGCNIVAGQFTWFTFSYLSVTTLTGTRAIVDTYWCSPFDLSFLSTIQWRHNERDGVSNQAHIKENIKDPRHWSLWGDSTGHRWIPLTKGQHYSDVMASRITSLTVVYSTVYSGADQRKHQSSAPLAFVLGIHRGPVNSPHKWP